MNRFSEFLLRQSRFLYLIILLSAACGAWSYWTLPSGVYPEFSFPRIAVIAKLGYTSPDRMVMTVVRPLEEAAGQVYGIRWIRSKTIRGAAEISIDFEPRVNMQIALQQVQTRISEIRGALPADLDLTIARVTPAIFPMMSFNLSTSTLTQADLYTIARYQIQPFLTRVPGVARVTTQGGRIPQLLVEADPQRLRAAHVSLSDISDALNKTNRIQVAGKLDERRQQNLVVATGETITPADLGGVVAAVRAGVPVFLRDLAQITNGTADPTSLVSVNGKPGVVINIFRQPNSNAAAVSSGVKRAIQSFKSALPPGVAIEPGYDESGLVKDAMKNVRDAISIGIVLIVIVLYAFLREWRSTWIAAVTIPLSALAAFFVLKLTGQTLNLMSLGGLAVAIGLVIDDAIVVVENVDRHLEEGAGSFEAARKAIAELAAPVMSSTVTTVVVFLPLGLLSGVTGQFFVSLTITLASAVIFSLFLALTLTPLLSAQFLTGRKKHPVLLMKKLEAATTAALRRFLEKPSRPAVLGAGLLAAGLFLALRLPTDFLPAMDEGSYLIDYIAPPGTSLMETGRLASKIEAILARTPEAQNWARRTGSENGLFATQPNGGDIQVVLKPAGLRKRGVFAIMARQREQIDAQVPQLDVDFHQILQDELNDLSGAPAPVEVRVFGENPALLRSISSRIDEKLGTVHGLVDRIVRGRTAVPEFKVRPDPLLAARLGLSTADVERQAGEALIGGLPTAVRRGDHFIDVRVRLSPADTTRPADLGQIPIMGQNGNFLPLSAVASIRQVTAEGEILRENQQRYVSIGANLENRDLGSANREIEKKLSGVSLPAGYRISPGGLYSSQRESFQQLLIVLALAVILVYAVLVFQFRDFAQPLAIFTAIPLALFGVAAALWITRTPLNVSSFMGVILLIGLVVKNGILLLEYANRLHAGGRAVDDALTEACRVRLRPILMTTLCTLLGLFPLALGLGAGAELQKPLAIAVIGGLSLSTFFTLFFVPVVFRRLRGIGAGSSRDFLQFQN